MGLRPRRDCYRPRTQGAKLKADKIRWEFNTSNAKLNPICPFLALLGAHHILHVSRQRVNKGESDNKFLLIILKESEAKSHLVDLNVDGKIILKSVGTDWFNWLGKLTSCRLYKRGKENKNANILGTRWATSSTKHRCAVLYHPSLNLLTPNDDYSGCIAPLTSKRCILYIYSTNTGTEYF